MTSIRLVLAAWLLVAAACASSPGPDASGPTPAEAGPTRAPPAPSPPAPPSPSPSATGPRECLPVAACNMFVRCALAEEVRAADGGRAFRVLQYEHQPQHVGALWGRGQTCWDARGEHRCADALQWSDAVCTPTPSAQMELDFACRMDGERCILVEH